MQLPEDANLRLSKHTAFLKCIVACGVAVVLLAWPVSIGSDEVAYSSAASRPWAAVGYTGCRHDAS